MRQARQRTQKTPILPAKRLRESASILVVALAFFLLIALFSFHPTDPGWSHVGKSLPIHNLTGKTGALLSDILLSLMGYLAYTLPFALFYTATKMYQEQPLGAPAATNTSPWWILRGIGLMMALLAGSALVALYHPVSKLPMGAGGALGGIIHDLLLPYLNYLGALVVFSGVLLAGLTLFAGLSWLSLIDLVGRWAFRVLQHTATGSIALMTEAKRKWALAKAETQAESNALVQIVRPSAPTKEVKMDPLPLEAIRAQQTVRAPLKPAVPPVKVAPPLTKAVQKIQPTQNQNMHQGEAPSLSLLEAAEASAHDLGFSEVELQALSELVEKRLGEFGVDVKVVAVSPGPVITRFELDLAAGVKVSKIVGLAKDLARALSVTSVRVVEIIPGKSTVGLEIPNQEREMVRLKEVLEDPAYQNARSPITLGLGKDIAGNVVVADLSKMPHLLVAGTTGAGKSVGLNAMLLSILYKATPQEVRLIMIDPKMLELAIYDDIPHLLTPVVTDMKEAANSLRWCVGEMERRYQIMAALGVRNLLGYNKKIEDAQKAGAPLMDPLWLEATGEPAPELELLPYIVVVIDEFADMMMVVGKKVEELIARIAQKARAAGIHLILATQRPSVDVITGLIKANIPTRIAYQVSSRIDSRTILDQSGAEQLLGHGDMLYLPPGVGIPIRVHGAFVADDEVHKVVHELRSRGKPDYIESITRTSSIPSLLDGGGDEDGESDELYDQAVSIVIESRRTSISYIQRRLKIGYNRAARLVEQMEFSGVVSPIQSNGGREVLVGSPSENA